MMDDLAIGSTVFVKETSFDGWPVRGTVEDVFPRPDWGGAMAYVVMLDTDAMAAAGLNPDSYPPGGEFTADRLEGGAAA
jgi:hypothetical protein